MYSKGYYARRKFFNSVGNLIWSVIMILFTLAVIGVCVYGCNSYYKIMGPAIE